MSQSPANPPRPKTQASSSFPRVDPEKDENNKPQSESNTSNDISTPPAGDGNQLDLNSPTDINLQASDAFISDVSGGESLADPTAELADHMHDFEQLPIEIRSLTERYVTYASNVNQ